MGMSAYERSQCEDIIHGHACGVVAGNLVPIPGLGAAVDSAALATMTMALASVFNVSITKTLALSIAVEQLRSHLTKRVLKELLKMFPGGSGFSAALTIGIIETAGWAIAEEFSRQRRGY